MKKSPLIAAVHQLALILIIVASWISITLVLITPQPLPALDANHDGMDDTWQARHGIAVFDGAGNPDGDARINLVEALNYSDPGSANPGLGVVLILDANSDGLDDRWQARFNIAAAQAYLDPDADGRKNIEESIVGSHPFVADEPWAAGQNSPESAAAGPESFTVGVPVSLPGLRHTLQQSDDVETWSDVPMAGNPFWGDGSAKSLAVGTAGAPRKFFRFVIDDPDSDGDNLGDWSELRLGLNALDVDSDNDGFDDWWEFINQSDPLNDQSVPSGSIDNQSPGEETGLVELPLIYGVQSKRVSNIWHTSGSSSYLQWHDDVSGSGSLSYGANEPFWLETLQTLQYPSGNNWEAQAWGVGQPVFVKEAVVAEHFTTLGSNLVNLEQVRAVMMVDDPDPSRKQPWDVSRRFLRVRTAWPMNGGAPKNYHDGFVTMTIQAGKRVSQPAVLAPLPEPDVWKEEMLSPMEVDSEEFGSLGMDKELVPPWMMLPLGQERGAWFWCGASDWCPFFFRMSPPDTGIITIAPNAVIAGSDLEGAVLRFTANGDPGISELQVGVHSEGPVSWVAEGVLRFAVYPRRSLKVTLHPIALLGRAIPQAVPTKQQLEEYLDNIFGAQCNVYSNVTVRPTIMVDWDVGMDTGGQVEGAGNGAFDIFPGSTYDSEEEREVIKVAQPNPTAHVNVYWLACPDDLFGIISRTRAVVDEQTGKRIEGRTSWMLGFAGKTKHDSNTSGIVYVYEYQHTRPPTDPVRNRPSDRRWVVAHEIAHHIGALGHSTGFLTTNFQARPNSDNESRLMTGLGGPKRYDCPPRLIKEEWDEIHVKIPKF